MISWERGLWLWLDIKHHTFNVQITQEVFIAALRSHTGNGKGNLCQVTSKSYVIPEWGAEKMFVFHLELQNVKKMFKGWTVSAI